MEGELVILLSSSTTASNPDPVGTCLRGEKKIRNPVLDAAAFVPDIYLPCFDAYNKYVNNIPSSVIPLPSLVPLLLTRRFDPHPLFGSIVNQDSRN
jgi:hypothetical protein